LKSLFALLLICAIPVCTFGQAWNIISISALRQESDVASRYSSADMKHLIKTAHTREEFGEVAAYFDRQAEIDAARYETEKRDLYRLLALRYHARSYSAQVENTRNRMDHFKALSRKCYGQAKLYRACANGDAAAGGIPAPLTK
jgi:hypothetical protein